MTPRPSPSPAAGQDWKVPAWVTPHNLILIAGAVVGVLVIVMLASAVRRLSKGGGAAAAPAPAPKSGGLPVKPLIAAAAVVGGYLLYEQHQHAAGPAKAAPAPSPTPTPTPTPSPTVTQTLAPHYTVLGHFPMTGSQILIAIAIIAVVAFAIVRTVMRHLS